MSWWGGKKVNSNNACNCRKRQMTMAEERKQNAKLAASQYIRRHFRRAHCCSESVSDPEDSIAVQRLRLFWGKKIVLIYIIYIHFSSLQSRLHGLTSDEVEPGSSEQDFYMNYLLLSLLLQSPWQARRDIFLFF